MTPRIPAPCHHELRPGTKVCLHCRRAEREATAARHRTILVRIGLTAVAIGACAFAATSGLDAWKNRSTSGLTRLIASPGSLEAAPVRALTGVPSNDPAATLPGGIDSVAGPAPVVPPPTATPAESLLAPLVATPADSAAAAPAALPQSAPLVAPPVARSLQPIVAQGRTELQNGMYALRAGDTVTVHFDTPEARTRRPEKFEQIIRSTLPGVHGPAADSLLAAIATGTLVGPTELVTDQRAISLRAVDGRSLSLWPKTRPGRDGPLVIAYRVTPAR